MEPDNIMMEKDINPAAKDFSPTAKIKAAMTGAVMVSTVIMASIIQIFPDITNRLGQ